MQLLSEENKSFQQTNKGHVKQVEWPGLSRESGLCVPGTAAYPASTATAGLERPVWPGLLVQKVPCRLIFSCGCRNMEALFNIFLSRCPENPLQATKLPQLIFKII